MSSCSCGWRGLLPEPSSSMVTSVKSRCWPSNPPSRPCPYCCVEEVGIDLEMGLFISKCYRGGPRMKEHGEFLKYLFKEHTRCCTYGQAIRIRALIDYPAFRSTLTAPLICLSMQSSAQCNAATREQLMSTLP